MYPFERKFPTRFLFITLIVELELILFSRKETKTRDRRIVLVDSLFPSFSHLSQFLAIGRTCLDSGFPTMKTLQSEQSLYRARGTLRESYSPDLAIVSLVSTGELES